jgi:hypothetical protein
MNEKEIYLYKIQELNELFKIECIANEYKDLEFRLFKRCVRKFVNEEQYKNICNLYNQAVDKFRKGMNYSDVKGFIDSK